MRVDVAVVSVVWLLSALVETFEEIALSLIFLFVHLGETVTIVNEVSSNWSELIEDVTTPNITLLNIIESLISSAGKLIDVMSVAVLVVLSPVSGKIKFGLLWVSVSPVAGPIDDKWHISAPFPEASQTLEVGLWECSRSCRSRYLITWQSTSHGDIIMSWEVVTNILSKLSILKIPTRHFLFF